MKIRSDFVSNSSSCSFVINTDNVALMFKTFNEAFHDEYFPYDVEDKVDILCYTKNKWYQDVYSYFNGEPNSAFKDTYHDYASGEMRQKDPEEDCWDSIRVTFNAFAKGCTEDTLKKITEVRFRCEDSTETGKFYLWMIYLFFERNGCCPDMSDTENSFTVNGSDSFLGKLACWTK